MKYKSFFKRWMILLIMVFLGVCVTTPEEYRKSMENQPISLENKKVFVITITHLKDNQDVASLNSGITIAIGTTKILPTVPDSLKSIIENFILQSIEGKETSISKEILDAASKVADFDTLLLVRTENVNIVTSLFGIIIDESPGIKLHGILYEVPSKRVLAVAQTRDKISEKLRQASLVMLVEI